MRVIKYIFDIETDSINATKIHCLSYCDEETGNIVSITDYNDMGEFFRRGAIYIGHNAIRFDARMAEKLLNINILGEVIDTLALSWYISSERMRHGLEQYGEEFGVEKPKIADWENAPIEDYIHRCEQDVHINLLLWRRQYRYLRELYDRNEVKIWELLRYLSFKMDCIADQERLGLKLDVEKCSEMLFKLQQEEEIKIKELTAVMPKVPVIAKKTAPKVILRKDGELTAHGVSWVTLLSEKGLPRDYVGEIEVIKGYEEPNPNSHDQLKKWLYGLGWVPENIKYVRDKKKGTVKKIPQIANKRGGGEVCESIQKLYEKEPKLELLGGLSVLSHRISIFEGFLRDAVDGILYPTTTGLTNTLRMQHGVIVNLPGLDKKYGEDVRGCLIPFENCVLLGSDLANIEDRTKRHYIYPYDPQYVEDMNVPGYCAHLEMGILSGMLTQEDADFYKEYEKTEIGDKKRFSEIKAKRNKSKITNFSATYKIGAEALARNSGMKVAEAKKLLDIYWKRNKAILEIEKACFVKQIGVKSWLLNPISGFYYQLRAEKDRFSTLNQGTAVYVFDVWLSYIRKLGLRINFQYHDEFVANIKRGEEKKAENIVNRAIELVNQQLKLNVQIGCSVHFGDRYSDIH